MTSEEIKKAMREFYPVICDGVRYKKINAYIYRIYKNPLTGKYKEVFQLELQDEKSNSVFIVEAEKVRLA